MMISSLVSIKEEKRGKNIVAQTKVNSGHRDFTLIDELGGYFGAPNI